MSAQKDPPSTPSPTRPGVPRSDELSEDALEQVLGGFGGSGQGSGTTSTPAPPASKPESTPWN